MATCIYCQQETGNARDECVPCSDAAEAGIGGLPDYSGQDED